MQDWSQRITKFVSEHGQEFDFVRWFMDRVFRLHCRRAIFIATDRNCPWAAGTGKRQEPCCQAASCGKNRKGTRIETIPFASDGAPEQKSETNATEQQGGESRQEAAMPRTNH